MIQSWDGAGDAWFVTLRIIWRLFGTIFSRDDIMRANFLKQTPRRTDPKIACHLSWKFTGAAKQHYMEHTTHVGTSFYRLPR
jgi:hypothetical protein